MSGAKYYLGLIREVIFCPACISRRKTEAILYKDDG